MERAFRQGSCNSEIDVLRTAATTFEMNPEASSAGRRDSEKSRKVKEIK